MKNNIFICKLIDQKKYNDDFNIDFEIDEFKKKCLIEGLDEIGLTLQQSNVIKELKKFNIIITHG